MCAWRGDPPFRQPSTAPARMSDPRSQLSSFGRRLTRSGRYFERARDGVAWHSYRCATTVCRPSMAPIRRKGRIRVGKDQGRKNMGVSYQGRKKKSRETPRNVVNDTVHRFGLERGTQVWRYAGRSTPRSDLAEGLSLSHRSAAHPLCLGLSFVFQQA